MKKSDWQIYIIYLIVNNWRWLKYVLIGSLVFLILKATNIL